MNEMIMPIGFLIFVGLFLFSQHQVKVAQKHCQEALDGWDQALKLLKESNNDRLKLIDLLVKKNG